MPKVNIVPVDEELISDKELCKRLEISYATLYNHLKNGPPSKRHDNVPDIRTVTYTVHNGQRKWFLSSVRGFLRGQKV